MCISCVYNDWVKIAFNKHIIKLYKHRVVYISTTKPNAQYLLRKMALAAEYPGVRYAFVSFFVPVR